MGLTSREAKVHGALPVAPYRPSMSGPARLNPLDVIIVGGGAAGYAAAHSAARIGLDTVCFEGRAWGVVPPVHAPSIPGILGPEAIPGMREQAISSGARLLTTDVECVDVALSPFSVWSGGEAWRGRCLILATGASPRRLEVEGEQGLREESIFYSAWEQGPQCTGQSVAVVGGGDSAIEQALHMARFAEKVTVIHRQHGFRACDYLMQKALAHPLIHWQVPAVVEGLIRGNSGGLEGVSLMSEGKRVELHCSKLIVAIGHTPRSALIQGQVPCDESGFVLTRERTTATNVPGVFAAGDVADPLYRKVLTAAASGCMAALDAQRWLLTSDSASPSTERVSPEGERGIFQ